MSAGIAGKAEKIKLADYEFWCGKGFNHTGKRMETLRRAIKRGTKGRYLCREINESKARDA